MEDTDLNWRKASYSSNGGGNCVEVADHGSRVLVRDTKHRTGPVLRFSPAAWRRFGDELKRSLASNPRRAGRRCRGAFPRLGGAPFCYSPAASWHDGCTRGSVALPTGHARSLGPTNG
jgi:hypothetical protein